MSEGLNRKLSNLERLLTITRSMAASVDIDSLLPVIVEEGKKLLDAERATLFLLDAKSNELYTRAIAGGQAFRVPANMGICGQSILTGQTINVPDAYADPRFNKEVDKTTGFRTRNILSVPLRDFKGQLVGVLQVINKRGGAFDADDVLLAETLASQAGVAVQRSSLIEHYVHKQHMEQAMQIARDIQQSLLPASNPAINGFDVAGFALPADETGGDTYDFMSLPGGTWMFIVADATGHGIGPAILAAETRAMLRAVSRSSSDQISVSQVLGTVNFLLEEDMKSDRFVTCFFGLLEPRASLLKYASAGHGPLLFYRRSDDVFLQESPKAIPLGVIGDFEFGEIDEFEFKDGDFLAVITDGYIEATNSAGEDFGIERVMKVLRRCRDLPAEKMIAELHAELMAFVGGMAQADDLTAVIIKKKIAG